MSGNVASDAGAPKVSQSWRGYAAVIQDDVQFRVESFYDAGRAGKIEKSLAKEFAVEMAAVALLMDMHPEFEMAHKEGLREYVRGFKERAEIALMRKVEGYTETEERVSAGRVVDVEVTYPPDLEAIKFYLERQHRAEWGKDTVPQGRGVTLIAMKGANVLLQAAGEDPLELPGVSE